MFEKIVLGKKVRSLKIFYFAEIWYDKCRHPILPYHFIIWKQAYLGVSLTVGIIMCHQTLSDIKLDLSATIKKT